MDPQKKLSRHIDSSADPESFRKNSTPVDNEKTTEVGSSSHHTECNEDKPDNRNKNGGSTVIQSRFPPRFAKQRKNSLKADSVVTPSDISVNFASKTSNTKDASPPPSFCAWENPITCSFSSRSPVVTSNTPSASICNTIIVSSCSSAIPTVDQMVASMSSSFHRGNHHDSDIIVSDQPASSASSERSSPNNHHKSITPMSSGKNVNSNEVSDLPDNRNKNGGSTVIQSRFPPRFAKQRKNSLKADSVVTPSDISVNFASKTSNTKDASPPPSFCAWENPITCSLSSRSPVVTSNTPSASICNTIIVSSCSSAIPTVDQMVASMSSSFHRSNHHDSDIIVSDQPVSSVSSERSSPNNHHKSITPMSSGKNVNSNEVSDLPHNQNKCGGSMFRQSRLPPRFAKQRENLVKSNSIVTPCDISTDLPSSYNNNKKGNTIVSSCSSDIPTDEPVIASTSKSNSFDHSDPYDSGIGVSGQPASAASSPSNHCKIITPTSSEKNVNSNEVSDLDIETNSLGTSDSDDDVKETNLSGTSDSDDDVKETNSSDTSDSDDDVKETNSSGTSDSDDDDIIYIGEFRKESPPQQLAVSEKEVEALKKECSERPLFKEDLYALQIKKEKLDDCIKKPTRYPLKSPHNGNESSVSRSGQGGLPPQFANQRGNLDKPDSVNNIIPWDMSADLTPKTSNTKDALAYPPPPVTSWEKRITYSAHSHSPVVTSNTPSTSISNTTIFSSCSSVIPTYDQVVASTFKPSSFDHSDQHDSDIGVSDQPASAASSERSSPSNDYKIITPMISENSNEVSDLPLNQKKNSGSRFREKKFPPRIAKQRENLVKAVSVNNDLPWDISVDLISRTSNTKDNASPSPSSSVTHSSCSHLPVITSNSPFSTIENTIVRSCSSVIPRDDQVFSNICQSSSFDHNDQHDSGIGANDQPASALSSQRSSPSDDFQIISPTSWRKNANSTDVPDLPHNRNKSDGSNFKQSNLTPQFKKQRENLLKAVSINNVFTCDIPSDLSSKISNTKDALPYPPPCVASCEKPFTHSVHSHSPVVTSNTPSTSISNTIYSSCSSVIPTDIQMLSSSSKSITFHRSDQHDSAIDISDQPASVVSFQRSPPSNDFKIISCGKSGNSNEVLDLVLENDAPLPTVMEHPQAVSQQDQFLTSYGLFCDSNKTTVSVYNNADNSSQNGKEAETTEMSSRENSSLQKSNSVLSKNIDHSVASVESHIQMAAQPNCMSGPHCTGPLSPQLMGGFEPKTGIFDITSIASSVQVAEIPVIPSPPTVLFNSSQQGEENSEMKLEFTFESCLEQLSGEKRRSSENTGHSSKKSRSTNISNFSTNVSVQSPISPSADDLILKIQSVKKVSGNDQPLPIIIEHPPAMSGENESSTAYGSFSGSSETTASAYNNADNSSQNKKEAESTEMSFRKNSLLQQSNSVLSKNVDHSVTSVKSHIQMAAQHNSIAGPHCTAPISPPLMGGFEEMTGICAMTGLSSPVQVAGIPAVESPSTVLFSSSQQGEENSEIKLFTFESGLEQLSREKKRSLGNTGHLSKKSKCISRCMNVSNSSTNISVLSPSSPSTDDLILKIQSVKKVLENDQPLPIIMEHPQAVAEENESSTSYGSFSGSSETTVSAYNNADNSSQNKKEAESTEMSFRMNSPLQQCNSVLSKNIHHSSSSVKSHFQMAAQHKSMAGLHSTGPLTPPLMGGCEAMTGNCSISGFSSSVQVAGTSVIPCPPIALFNCSQQVWENDPSLPIIMEHPQAVAEENESSKSYGSFSGSSETTASAYNNADNSSQNKKEAESTEISFRVNSPLQQSNSVLSKNIHHSSSSVKSHFQMAAQHKSMAGPHCTGPLTPPLMGGFEAMTGNCAISGFSSSVQVAGTKAIPCPSIALFSCSQQPCNRNKSDRSRFGRYRLPSRFVKQRKNLVKAISVNNVTDWDISGDLTSRTSNTKDASPSPPPSVNAWESPPIHSLHPHFPVVTSNTPSTSIGNTIVSSSSSVIPTDDQVVSSTSKSSSFDHSDQHDSGIDDNDQTASALSSQRSSASNDCQIIAVTSVGKNANLNEVPDLNVAPSTCDALPSIGASLSNKFKDSAAEREEKECSLPISFHSERKNCIDKKPSKISKRKIKKSRHLETSSPSPSLCDYILNYHKLPKDYNCVKCSFSCLSWQMFKTHSCSDKLKQMAACKVIVEKIADNHNESAKQFICPKCGFYSSNNPKHSCDERLRYMQNCFVKLERIKRSKVNGICPIKVAQICNYLHQTLILKAKLNVIKNAKICNTVDEVMKHIVEPIAKINGTLDSRNSQI